MALTDDQQRFVDEYLIDLNATQAAGRAGHAPEQAYAIGCANLKNAQIAAVVAEAKQKRLMPMEMTQDYVIAKIAATIERCFQDPLATEGVGRELGGHRQDKFDPANVLRGCVMLGKHLGMFRDKKEDGGKSGLCPTCSELENLTEDELGARIIELLTPPCD